MGALARTDIRIEQGATFGLLAELQDEDGGPVDLTGCTARMKIRAGYNSPVLLSLVSPTNIVINPTLGTVLVTVTASATELLGFSRGVYDLEVVFPDGTVIRALQGEALLARESTS